MILIKFFKTETGDDEALIVVRAGIPNMTGHGERLETSFRAGTGGTSKSQLEYRLPIRWNLLKNLSNNGSCFTASLFR